MAFEFDNSGSGSGSSSSFADNLFNIYDMVDPSKKLKFDVGGSAGTTETIRTNQTVSSIVDIPDQAGVTDTFVLQNLLQTLSNKSVSDDITLINANFNNAKVGKFLATNTSTALISGGVLSINGGNTAKFDISAGTGIIIDYSTSTAPTIKNVSFGPFVAQTVTNLASADYTYIYIDNTGAIVQTTITPTPQQRRTTIQLGRLNTSNRSSISFADTNPDFEFSGISQFGDLADALGPFNVDGNIVTPNGVNLSFNKSSGNTFQKGFNYSSSTLNPHVSTTAGLVAASFRYQNQTGSSGGSVTVIDPTNYDLAGVTTAVPNPAQTATVQRVYLFSDNNIRVQRGQATYTNLSAAVNGYPNESFTVNPVIQGFGILIAYIAIQKNSTDLSDSTTCRIIPAGRFGATATGGGGTGTLQGVYNNSVQPQIVLNATQGGLLIRDASVALGAVLLAIQNNAGSSDYLKVLASGVTMSSLGLGVVQSSAAGLLSSSNGTTGQFLRGVTGSQATWQTLPQPNVQTLTGSGTYTPTAGTVRIEVEACGGGGEGAAPGGTGNNGGDTTFGGVTLGKGFGGNGSLLGAGGTVSGSVSNWTVLVTTSGGDGSGGVALVNTAGGAGGVNNFGGGGGGGSTTAAGTAGKALTGAGGGGAGGTAGSGSGGGGGAGAYIKFQVSPVAASYSYSIGAGGGGAGTGGDGGGGNIVVREYPY